MKKEDIQKSALESCVIDNSIYNDEFQPYFMDGFKDGAEWRINSVWHKDINKGKMRKAILVQFDNGLFKLFEDIRDLKGIEDKIEAFAYVNDLLPSKED